jgi:predicted glutamine amidotransferase
MCGIGGFSLSEKSNLNSRKIANVMLTSLERRGNQASGAAWHSRNSVGYLKRPVAGSRLSLKPMPRKTDAVILHTRLATHGSIKDARNNHPVLSPSGNTQVVHNGVIYNHDRIRPELPKSLPQVDSSVIPALIESGSLEALSKLDGDAAIAWLSNEDYGTLKVARISHSPMVIAQVKDGSFFFASTPDILAEVLRKLGLKSTFELVMSERMGYAIRKGNIVETLQIPDLDPAYEDRWVSNKSSFRSATSGNANALGYGKSSKYGYSGWQSDWWEEDLTPATDDARSEYEDDFEIYLSNFIEMNRGEFFDYDGYYVGDRQDLYEQFEKARYESWWTDTAEEQLFGYERK